jgi:hypothetical protein
MPVLICKKSIPKILDPPLVGVIKFNADMAIHWKALEKHFLVVPLVS